MSALELEATIIEARGGYADKAARSSGKAKYGKDNYNQRSPKGQKDKFKQNEKTTKTKK